MDGGERPGPGSATSRDQRLPSASQSPFRLDGVDSASANAPRTIVCSARVVALASWRPVPSCCRPIPYISATMARAWRSRLGDAEGLQRGGGELFVGGEAALRGLLQLGVAGGSQVQLHLRQRLGAIEPLGDRPLHLRRDLLGARVRRRARRPSAMPPYGDLLPHIKQQALAQQRGLAGEVVGERAERDPGGTGDAAVAAARRSRRGRSGRGSCGGSARGRQWPGARCRWAEWRWSSACGVQACSFVRTT